MTRQHFRALAAAIATVEPFTARRQAAEAVARVCKQFNPAFNASKFMEACDANVD